MEHRTITARMAEASGIEKACPQGGWANSEPGKARLDAKYFVF